MMKKFWKKGLALCLSCLIALEAPLCFPASVGKSYGAERPATVQATALNVRSAPGTGNTIIGKLSYGAAVTVLGEAAASDGAVWYQIRFTGTGGVQATGYVLSSYIKFSTASSTTSDFEAYLNSQGFPESYRPALRELHAKYPQWIFTAFDTGLDWNDVIQNESLVGRNLVSSSSISSWKSTANGAYDWGSSTWPGFDGSSWVAASEDIIRYYMDPRNFINETYIFQFLSQSYDASIHTREGLVSLVKGTFLEGSAPVGSTYAGAGAADENGSGSGTTIPGDSGSTGNSGSQTSPGTAYGPGYDGSSGGTSGTAGNGSNGNPGTSGSSGVVVGEAPGGESTGTGNGTAASPDAGGTSTGVGTGTAPGSSSTSNVTVGAAPGMNLSKADSGDGRSAGWSDISVAAVDAGSKLSISRHQAERVAATVIRVGPGGDSSTSSGSSGSTYGPSGGGTSAAATGRTAPYVDILMQAGVESGVNPYVLAAMILQEQGTQGNSQSISGASGYYNFYNFEAYASNGMTAVERGLWYASQSGDYMRPWNTVDKSIIGGACQYGQNYVQAGQNTFYLKKFNVQGSNLYKHQYMTNVEGAASEGARMGEAYSESMRQTAMQFSIPVYRNMPAEACSRPVIDGSPNNKLSAISVDGFTMTPSFDRDTNLYNVTVNSSVTSVMLRATAIDSSAQISGTGTVNLTDAVTDAQIFVTAQNGYVREYTVRITRSDSGPFSNGTVGDSSGGVSSGNTYGPGADSAASQGSSGAGPGGSAGGSSAGNGSSGALTGPGGSNVTIVQ
ncbi:MAG: SH3 domain-containing protein [Lachnospiraceae bacterium]|nr:SH3 domain-containing protein [Lachnospiraceae bacterium]